MANKRNKILVFSPFYPPHIGGVENYTQELCENLSKEVARITIFTPNIPTYSPQQEIVFGNVEIIRFPAFEIISNYPLPKFWTIIFWRLFSELFRKDFSIVISQTRFFNTSLLALFYAKMKKKKWIHVEHGSSFVQTDNFLVSLIAKTYDVTIGKLILNSADQLIAISESVKNFVHTLAPKKDCIVIYRGFDAEKIESIKPNLPLKEKYKNDTIIIYIGRLISGKGVADLLNAFSGIKKEDVRLFIIGDGPEKNSLEKLAIKLNIIDRTIFFGHKSFEEAMAALKISDIFVNPSHSEGLPTAVVEAAICKKAILATNAGGTSEIIENGKSGIIIEARNAKLIQKKLELLINNMPLRKNLGENAFKEVIMMFSWKNCIKYYLNLFKKSK